MNIRGTMTEPEKKIVTHNGLLYVYSVTISPPHPLFSLHLMHNSFAHTEPSFSPLLVRFREFIEILGTNLLSLAT